jgi:methionyl-tRNA formyltransferase
VTEVADVNAPEVVAAIRAARPDLICVVDFGQMVRAEVRGAAPLGAINLHGSILPGLRGAAPVNWAIIRGFRHTGVTTFSLVDRMDAGDVYLQAETDIRPEETAAELRQRLSALGAGVMADTAAGLAAGSLRAQEQDHSKATAAPRLKKTDGVIDWAAGAETIRNLIHGTWPWPAGQARFRRKDGHEFTVEIARAAVAEAGAVEPAGSPQPGVVGADLAIATGDGRLRIVEIQPAGKRLMGWKDFVNGYRVTAGDRFGGLGE